MQFFDQRIYIVTTDGTLACIDASPDAIASAQEGNIPQAKVIKVPNQKGIAPSSELQLAAPAEVAQGVIVECYREGSKLRIRAVSPGYNPNWKVQFSRDIRTEGDRYLVQELRESSSGGFYRTFGEIKKIVDS
jgi:hypothetical protein